MSTKKQVVAVVVTFNRLDLLKRCLAALRSQTYGLSQIIVVNNGSTDGTREWLDEQIDLLVFHQENVGGAGGFSRGISEALKLNIEWVWIMDDDGYADYDCLRNLANYASPYIQYLAPNLIDLTGKPHFPSIVSDGRELVWHPGGPFNGILLGRELLMRIGTPMVDFFIWGDEFEFLNRVFAEGYLTVLVPAAIFNHKSTVVDFSKASRYYFMVRNYIWRAKLVRTNCVIGRKAQVASLVYAVFLVFVKLVSNGNLKGLRQSFVGLIIGATSRPRN